MPAGRAAFLTFYRVLQAQQAAGSAPSVSLPHHAPPLAMSRQPSSLYDEDTAPLGLSMTLSMTLSQHEDDAPEGDAHADTHSCASYSLGLYPQRSPRGSTRGSSLNHSHRYRCECTASAR